MVGGLGFIGKRIVQSLVSLDEEVRVLDWAERSGWRLENVEFMRGDATSFSTVYDASKDVELVVNLAAYIDAVESVSQPLKYLSNNIAIHSNILEAARRFSVRKIILASSAAVYGNQAPPLREDSETRAENPYGLSKICAEQLSIAYHRSYGLDATILRYFNVIGEGGRNVLKIFVENASAGKPLVVRGMWNGGEFHPALRDFIYVEDVAEATVKALKLETGQYIFNIGSGKGHSVLELAELVHEELQSHGQIILEQLSLHEPSASWADISRAQELLKWRPKTSLETAVKKYVKWYKEEKNRVEVGR